jgi:hypothetical protein
MHSNLRRGLLGTLFAGGLLAFGATAANAADTTGPDLTAAALVSAAASANPTSLGLLGGSTPSDTLDVAAALDVNVGAGNVGAGNMGAGDGLPGGTNGTGAGGNAADVDALADVNLGRPNDPLTASTAAVAADISLGLGGTDGLPGGTNGTGGGGNAADVAALADVNLGRPNDPLTGSTAGVAADISLGLGGTDGLPGGTNSTGTTAGVAALADINLGGTDGLPGNTDGVLDAAVDLALGLDTTGLPDGTTADAGGSVIIGGSADSRGNPGTTGPGTGTGTGTTGDADTPGAGTDTPAAGSDTLGTGTNAVDTTGSAAQGFTMVSAGTISGAVTTGAAAPAARASTKGGSELLAKTGMDASLVPLGLILLVAGVLLLRRRRTS